MNELQKKRIANSVDHTLLNQCSTWEEIKVLCDEAVAYDTASVCIPPCFVAQAKRYLGNRKKVCTVIGFPNGYSTTAVKVFETTDAIANGADEIDMVINIAKLKEEAYDYIRDEIRQVRAACRGRILKVIIETCLLTEQEKIAMCGIVTECGADYIKTSTGFSAGGATFADVRLFAEHIGSNVKIKAAGGVSTMEDAGKYLEIGAERIGTSRIVGMIKAQEK